MKIEDARHWLEIELRLWESECKSKHPVKEALDMAIKALEQEPILEKIRDEIADEKEYAYADFERYKVEYLGQDWEDIDCPPQDDFRYGMERAIEIIDKYKAEMEDEK